MGDMTAQLLTLAHAGFLAAAGGFFGLYAFKAVRMALDAWACAESPRRLPPYITAALLTATAGAVFLAGAVTVLARGI